MTTDARRRATAKYQREHTRQVIMRLNRRTDADILARFDACENIQGYIKRLVREDIERSRHEHH